MKLGILILLAAILWWSLSSLERRSLYYPDRTLFAKPSVYGVSFNEMSVSAQDGTRICGWYVPGVKPLTLMFCHGNAGNISHRLDKAMRLRKTGANLLLFDYRGYGMSSGRPSEKGLYQDAEAAYQYLVQDRKVKPEQVVFYGESLGCAVALEMALRHPCAGVVLESPFTSTVDMGKRFFPWLPVRWIVRDCYDNLTKIAKVRAPLMVLHSPQDEIVPFGMGQRLFAAAPGPKRFVELRGGHNEGYADSGDRYVRALDQFLTSLPQNQ